MQTRLGILEAMVKAADQREVVDEIVARSHSDSEMIEGVAHALGFTRIEAAAVIESTVRARGPETIARIRAEIEKEKVYSTEDRQRAAVELHGDHTIEELPPA